jgi:hypothetical protein
MKKWRDGKIDLGRGWQVSVVKEEGGWGWYLHSPGALTYGGALFKSASSAQGAATRWLRSAIKTAMTLVGF